METSSLTSIAKKIALEAGIEIYRLRQSGVTVAETKSSQTDIVTEADAAAEKLITQMLKVARPNDGIFGEEGSRITGTSGITWVIDPIDGTVNYLYDLPAYCVSIAACVDDAEAFSDGRRAIAAAVYNPSTQEMFWAAENAGAFTAIIDLEIDDALGSATNRKISVSAQQDLGDSLVATGFGYTPERRMEQIELLTKTIAHIRDIRRFGSAAYDLCLLAAGRIDAYFEKGIQPWDWAAGALIAKEAGATILGLGTDSLPGEPMFIAGNETLATGLQNLLKS